MGAAGYRPPTCRALPARWQLCAAEPGAPPPGDGADWLRIDGPLTAAAALRDARRWSLGGPTRDFDANDWWYSARFDGHGLHGAVLGLDGLATLAEVELNGQAVLQSESMFL